MYNRVVEAYLAGEKPADIAKKFHKSLRTVYRMTKDHRFRINYKELMNDWNTAVPADIIVAKYKYANILSLYSSIAKLRRKGFAFEKRRITYSFNSAITPSEHGGGEHGR